MEKEIIYQVFTQFGTCVDVSYEDYITTLKEARFLHLPYHIEVDKDYSSTYFVSLFNWI